MYMPNYYNQNPYLNNLNNINPQIPYNQSQMQQQFQEQNYQDNNCGIIWVQGEAAAKAYPVLKGNTVPLWDSESQTIYIKSVDNSGMPSMRVIVWNDRQGVKNNAENTILNNNPVNDTDYVTRNEFDEIVEKINALSSKINNNYNGKQKINNKGDNENA